MLENAAVLERESRFRRGVQAGISIAIGYMPIAMTYGLVAKTTGLSLFETFAMSVFVFAGAAQFIALSLISLGAGAFEMIFTTFIVNIRHMLMTASINEKAVNDPPILKAIYAFGVTDETFAVSATRDEKLTAPFMFGVNLIAYTSWVAFSGVGFLVGASLPSVLQESMSIALYAMFVGLLVPSLKKHRKYVVLAATAAILNSVLTLLQVSTGWAIVLATLISAAVVEWLWNVTPSQKKGGER